MFDGPPPIASQAEAYRVQMEVARLRIDRGEALAGYKIGCVSVPVRRQLQMERPLFGHVFSTEIHRSGVELDAGHFANLAVEGEFAVRLAEDMDDADWLRSHREAIASVFPVIELHNYVLRGQQHSVELIANNGLHAGAILPVEEGQANNAGEMLDEPISVLRNGDLLGRVTSDAIPGGPFESLRQLAEHLKLYGIALKRGQLILTGSPLPLYPVQPGDRIEVVTGSLGRVEMSVCSARPAI